MKDSEMLLLRVREWLDQSQLKATKIEDPQNHFHFVVSETNLPSVEILHQKPESEFLLFVARIIPPEEMQRKILDLVPENRRRLFFEIRLRLLSVGVEFAVVGAETQVPSAYELYLRLFFDGSNINDFWQMYVRMKSACIIIITLYQNFLGEIH